MIQSVVNKAVGAVGIAKNVREHSEAQAATQERQAIADTRSAEAHQAQMQYRNLLIERQKMAIQRAQEHQQAIAEQRRKMTVRKALAQQDEIFGSISKRAQDAYLQTLSRGQKNQILENARAKIK